MRTFLIKTLVNLCTLLGDINFESDLDAQMQYDNAIEIKQAQDHLIIVINRLCKYKSPEHENVLDFIDKHLLNRSTSIYDD